MLDIESLPYMICIYDFVAMTSYGCDCKFCERGDLSEDKRGVNKR
jgi:hypothetical protein